MPEADDADDEDDDFAADGLADFNEYLGDGDWIPLPDDIDDDPSETAYNPILPALEQLSDAVDAEEEDWIDEALDRINEYGARRYLRRLLSEVRDELLSQALVQARLTAAAAASDEEVIDELLTHLEGQQVVAYDLGEPGGNAWLFFDDDHGLPLFPATHRRPSRRSLKQLIGLAVVGAIVERDKSGERQLRLLLHADPEAGLAWRDADTPRKARARLNKLLAEPGLASLTTNWRSAVLLFCPHMTEDDEPQAIEVQEALGEIEAHLGGQRVAHELALPGGSLALIFDDGHLLPVRPAPGRPPVSPADLEPVVGRFLLTALPDGSSDAPYISLFFHDQLQAHAAALAADDGTPEGRAQLAAELRADPAGVAISLAPDSLLGLRCPGAHPDRSPSAGNA